MHLSHDGKFIRSDIWREGDYLDLWSVPHLLSGMVFGLAMHFLNFGVIPTFAIGVMALVGYEMFEIIVKIEETKMNRVLDVVVGMTSFTPAFLLAPTFPEAHNMIILVSVAILDGAISWIGWDASQKAAKLEKKLRAEIEEQKERIEKGSNRIRKKIRERHFRRLERRKS